MRKVISIVFLLFLNTNISLACTCSNEGVGINNLFITSYYVLKANIIESFDSANKDADFYKILVEPIEIYKGSVQKDLIVRGNIGFGIISCTLSVNKDETWLIFAKENDQGQLVFDYCSGSKELREKSYSTTHKKWMKEDYTQIFKSLDFLKKEAQKINRNFYVTESGALLSKYLNKYESKSFDKDFAQYLITFNKNFAIENVEVLVGLSQKIDQELVELFKKQVKWKVPLSEKPKENFQHILGIYHYTEDKNFLSPYFLY